MLHQELINTEIDAKDIFDQREKSQAEHENATDYRCMIGMAAMIVVFDLANNAFCAVYPFILLFSY